MVFTDGYSYEDPSMAARALRQAGVDVYAVTVDGKVPRPNFGQLASITGSRSRVFRDRTYANFLRKLHTYNELC